MSGTGSSTILPAVEQRIGSSSQPLEGAGFDPAFVPGLTSPVTAEPADAKPAEADDAEAVVDSEEVEKSGPDAGTDAETDAEAGEAEEPDASAAGPVFEASDRRARITAGQGFQECLNTAGQLCASLTA